MSRRVLADLEIVPGTEHRVVVHFKSAEPLFSHFPVQFIHARAAVIPRELVRSVKKDGSVVHDKSGQRRAETDDGLGITHAASEVEVATVHDDVAGLTAIPDVAKPDRANVIRSGIGGDGGGAAVVDDRHLGGRRRRSQAPMVCIKKIPVPAYPGIDDLCMRGRGKQEPGCDQD